MWPSISCAETTAKPNSTSGPFTIIKQKEKNSSDDIWLFLSDILTLFLYSRFVWQQPRVPLLREKHQDQGLQGGRPLIILLMSFSRPLLVLFRPLLLDFVLYSSFSRPWLVLYSSFARPLLVLLRPLLVLYSSLTLSFTHPFIVLFFTLYSPFTRPLPVLYSSLTRLFLVLYFSFIRPLLSLHTFFTRSFGLPLLVLYTLR